MRSGSGSQDAAAEVGSRSGRYPTVFSDPEEPSKGRFLNCPTGSTCGLVNSQMLKSYALEDSFTNFRPGTARHRGRDLSLPPSRAGVVYYWSPTPLMGQVDVVKLEEKPGVNETVTIEVDLQAFHDEAPELLMLEKVNVPIDLLNQNLARMSKRADESARTAKIFLKEHPEVWHALVSETQPTKSTRPCRLSFSDCRQRQSDA